mmetsp:Transcript_7572/g.22702  ORF Transcript_7572/g.22702 Transcript_7572/m.22702 type:complete len:173 (+) Transcript_7572:279-797(+)
MVRRSGMDELDGQSLGGGARLRGFVLRLDSDIEVDGCQVRKVECEESRLLLERLPVDLLVVGCLRVPVLASLFVQHGLYFTSCAPAAWYGEGLSGFFVLLFVCSKIAELMDTVLLLLAGKPVIALQWWHHSTVLLYCWHSYSTRIATGLWFAAMNYSVHAVMYGYFALMSTP